MVSTLPGSEAERLLEVLTTPTLRSETLVGSSCGVRHTALQGTYTLMKAVGGNCSQGGKLHRGCAVSGRCSLVPAFSEPWMRKRVIVWNKGSKVVQVVLCDSITDHSVLTWD